MPQQLLGGKAHHLTKSGVDVGDTPLVIARTQTRDQRILHGFAKRQSVCQVRLDTLASAHVPRQQSHHARQRNGHHGHKRSQNIWKEIRRSAPAIKPQHQGIARQCEQLFCSEHARTALGRTVHSESGAIGLGERDFLATQQLRI